MKQNKKVICYYSASAGDWGGASRVLFTNLKFLDREKFEPLVLLPDTGPVIPLLDKLGIKYVIWGKLHEPKGPLAYIKAFFKSVRFFRRQQVDIFHINNCNYWRAAEIPAAWFARVPMITHYHVVIEKPEPGPFVKMSRLLIANSEFTATHSETDNVPIEVVYPAVDTARFDNAISVRDQLGLPDDITVISFIGQIRNIKGVDLFIDLAKNMAGKKCIFLIVGRCRDPDIISDTYTEESLQKSIGDAENIKYIGYRQDVENLYRSSDIIVMPSRWDEPFGLINIEAGAARRPIVATRVGGIPEIISHGENGFLVDRDDLAALTKYTARLMEDKKLRTEMGNRARQSVQERFTHQPIRKLEKIYTSLARIRQ